VECDTLSVAGVKACVVHERDNSKIETLSFMFMPM